MHHLPKARPSRTDFYQNPVLTQAGRQINQRHDQYLHIQNSRRIGEMEEAQERQALEFTRAAQMLKERVSVGYKF